MVKLWMRAPLPESKFFQFHAAFGEILDPSLQIRNLPFKIHNFYLQQNMEYGEGEDPRFPLGRGGQPSRACQHMILHNFPQNCTNLRKFWTAWARDVGGGGGLGGGGGVVLGCIQTIWSNVARCAPKTKC